MCACVRACVRVSVCASADLACFVRLHFIDFNCGGQGNFGLEHVTLVIHEVDVIIGASLYSLHADAYVTQYICI